MGLVTAHYIRQAHWNNECQNFIAYGALGYGKTSYALQVLMEIYDTEDPAVLEKYFAFTPEEFLKMVRGFKKQVPAVVWDDAGVWLYYMDYAQTMTKQLSKMMQMVRTKTASTIFTTPTPTLILGKLRNFPQTLTLKIIKTSGNSPLSRRANGYRSWFLPDFKHSGVRKVYEDDFSVMLPNAVYEWYNKKRLGYVKMLEDEIEKALLPSLKEEGKNVEAAS
jgi:hypothetical protein